MAVSEAGWPASQGPWNSLGYEEEADAAGQQEYAAAYNAAISTINLILKINDFQENLFI